MQTTDGLNDEKYTSDIEQKIKEILENFTPSANKDENATSNDLFTSNLHNVTIDSIEEPIKDKTLDNYEFAKWFSIYNNQLEFFKGQVNLLKKEILKRDEIIEKLKGENNMNEDTKLLLEKIDDLGKNIDKKINDLDNKIDSKLIKIHEELTPIHEDLAIIKANNKKSSNTLQTILTALISPIIVGVIIGVILKYFHLK